MHIALNAHLLAGQAGYRSAGIHGYIHHLLRHLPAAAPTDWRFTAFVGKQTPMDYEGMTVRRSSVDTTSPARRILWEQFAQPTQLRGFDLYHALAFVAPLALTAPSVVTVYDLSFIHHPERLPAARRLYLRLLTGLTCRRARRVIAISQSTARDVARTYHLPPDRIDVAACGYDAEVFHPLPAEAVAGFRARNQLPARFWFFVGTLEPRKNLPTLFEAYARLPESERLPLIVGGAKGWQYEDIFAAVERLDLGDAVRFVDYVPTDALAFWYNCAELFVYPSVYEGFGLPVLEAMACGTPVVVSDASSLPEVAGDAGRLVPPFDVTAWADALRDAFHDGEWRAAARERGLSRAAGFNWRKTAEATIMAYHRALGGL